MAGERSRTAAMFGCNTYAYMLSQPAERCIEHLADRGFQEFELMVHPGHLWPGELSAPKRAALLTLLARRSVQPVAMRWSTGASITKHCGTSAMR